MCPNNCVLFRNNLEKDDVCPVCSASRWKVNDGKKKIPDKVLRHFPMIPNFLRYHLYIYIVLDTCITIGDEMAAACDNNSCI